MPAIAESLSRDRFPAVWSIRVLLPEPHPQLARIHALWMAAAGAGASALPRIGTIGPVQLKPVLPDVHVYDVRDAAPRYAIRLIGTRMSDHMGLGLTGKPVDEIPGANLRLVIGEILGAVETRRATIHIKAPRAVALPNGDHHSLESLWMPFSDDGATVTRVIAVSLLGDLST